MKPEYYDEFAPYVSITTLLDEIPWVTRTDARLECFMAEPVRQYTYGSGRGVRTYESVPYHALISKIQRDLNMRSFVKTGGAMSAYNVCFLNRYDTEKHQLGWHADDSPTMDHAHPIAVVSFGQEREIWWRAKGQTGVIPADQRRLLKHGSLFVMPPGFQKEFEHRIPKGDRVGLSPRVSLTYRRFI